METVFADYGDQVQFYYVYKSVEHPGINNFVSAFTLEERLLHVATAKKRLQTKIPWICDNMENDFQLSLGGAPNGEFVIDPDGKIVRKRFWSNPATLRSDLEELVGPVEKITTVDDLPARFVPETREIASGVVPRIELPSQLVPLVIKPTDDGGNPFFAKLRVEATRPTAASGEGQLHLLAYVDPIHEVHWNNRAGKVHLKIEPTPGQSFSKTELTGPEVEVDADIDPRQFLIDVDLGKAKNSFLVEMTYTVCDDAETFCQTITQKYEVFIKLGGEYGSRPEIFMPKMFAKVREMDANGDGNLTKDELPEGKVTLYIGHMDFNGNEIIESDEIDNFLAMFNNGRGFASAANDGSEPEDSDE